MVRHVVSQNQNFSHTFHRAIGALKIYRRIILILMLVLPACVYYFLSIQSLPHVSAQSEVQTKDQSQAESNYGNLPVDERFANIPYFIESKEMHSTLTLNNNHKVEATATVTVYNKKGEHWQLPDITLPPKTPVQLPMNDLLATAPEDFKSGNVQISYRGIPMGITSQMTITSTDEGISFESLEADAADFISKRLDGIVWMSDDETEAHVALTNASLSPIKVTITSGTGGKSLHLSARETQVINLKKFMKDEGRETLPALMTLEHDGAPGALIATGFSFNRKGGYSSNINFFDCGTAKSNKLAGAHVRIGVADQKDGLPEGTSFRAPLVLANTMHEPSVARISVDYTTNSSPHHTELKSVTLVGGEAKVIDLGRAMARRGIKGPFDAVGVDVTYTGMEGSVIGRLTSIDENGKYSFDVPVKDPLSGDHRTNGSYPWRLNNGYNTILHLKNTVDKEVLAIVQLRYENGSGVYNPERFKLAPFQTIAIDIRQLRDAQQKDGNDVAMPADVQNGQVVWFEEELNSLIGRAEIINEKEGIASSFSCGGSCGSCSTGTFYYSSAMSPTFFNSFVGEHGVPFLPRETKKGCDGTSYGPYNVTSAITWSSNNTSYASVGSSSGAVSCVAPGSATINACWNTQVAVNQYGCQPVYANVCCGAPINIGPRINSISPVAGLVGTTVAVTISGQGFSSGSGPVINSMSGISVAISSYTNTQINANFTIDVNASGGDRNVIVSTGANMSSNSVPFYVQIPSRIALTYHPNAPSGIGTLQTPNNQNVYDLVGGLRATNQCGVYRNYAYALLDQRGGRIVQGFRISEVFSNYSGSHGTPTANPSDIPPNLVIPDIQLLSVNSPQCLQYGDSETFLIGFNVTVSGRVFPLSTIVSVERGNVNGTLKADATIITN